MARDRGDRWLEAEATISLASGLAEDEPAAATALLLEANAVAAASGSRDLRDAARSLNAEAAATRGDLTDEHQRRYRHTESRVSGMVD